MSTIKVDTIATRTGSGNITASNTIVGNLTGNVTGNQSGGTVSATNITASGTLGVTGNTTVGGTLVNTGLITASAGVAIGGTGSANTLDDYEEGTWTPNWSTPGGSLTYSSQSGVYTKVGRVVHWKYQLNISGGSAGSGNVQVGGLPFTPTANLQLGRFPLQTSSVNFDGNAFTMYHYVSGGTLHVLYSYDNGGWAVATTSNFTVTNGSILTSKGSYFV